MRKFAGVMALLALLWAVPGQAQQVLVSKGQQMQNAVTSTANGSTLDTSSYAYVMFYTSITVTATVTYEGTVDNTNYFSLTCYTLDSLTGTSTSTATQAVRCNVTGIPKVRARISSYGSGSVSVSANAITAGAVRDSVVAGTVSHGSAPTGGSVGTTLTSGSTDAYGQFTAGQTSTEIRFTTAYTSAPFCVGVNATAARGVLATTSTTGFLVSGLTVSDKWYWQCSGGQ